jgi:hypothetical protein
MGGLPPALSRPGYVLARHVKISQNIGVNKMLAPTKISLIFAKL